MSCLDIIGPFWVCTDCLTWYDKEIDMCMCDEEREE